MSFRGLDFSSGLNSYRDQLAEGWRAQKEQEHYDTQRRLQDEQIAREQDQRQFSNRISAQKAAEDTGVGIAPNSPFHDLIEYVPMPNVTGPGMGSTPQPLFNPAVPDLLKSPEVQSGVPGQAPSRAPSGAMEQEIQNNIMELARRYPQGVNLETGYVHPFIAKAAETAALKKLGYDTMAARVLGGQAFDASKMAYGAQNQLTAEQMKLTAEAERQKRQISAQQALEAERAKNRGKVGRPGADNSRRDNLNELKTVLSGYQSQLQAATQKLRAMRYREMNPNGWDAAEAQAQEATQNINSINQRILGGIAPAPVARTAPMPPQEKTVVEKQINRKLNKTRLKYSDGSIEDVNGIR